MHTQLRLWKMVVLSGHFLHFCPPVFTLFIATSLAAIALVAAGTSTLNFIFKTFRSLHTYLILVLPTKTSQKSFSSELAFQEDGEGSPDWDVIENHWVSDLSPKGDMLFGIRKWMVWSDVNMNVWVKLLVKRRQ